MIGREVIIIPRDGEFSDDYSREKAYNSHRNTLLSYIIKNKIVMNIDDDLFAYTLAVEMAYLKYIVICTDEKEFSVYLPTELTQKQADWFSSRRIAISKKDLLITYIENINKDEIEVKGYEKGDSNIDPVVLLYSLINNRTLKDEKEKVKKYGNI